MNVSPINCTGFFYSTKVTENEITLLISSETVHVYQTLDAKRNAWALLLLLLLIWKRVQNFFKKSNGTHSIVHNENDIFNVTVFREDVPYVLFRCAST